MKKVVIIGAGNVATHLAVALQKNGFAILQVFSRTEASAKKLAELLQTTFTTDLNHIDRQADLYFYCVSDHILGDIIDRFNHTEGLHIHTAGSIPATIFSQKRTHYGVLYPLQTFSKQKELDFRTVPLFIEANNEQNKATIEEIASLISDKVYCINSDERIKLHVSAVFACNFSNHLYHIASELLSESHLPFDLLMPLVEETVQKLKSLSPYEAQTGPAVRNDFNVLNKHLQSLANDPKKHDLYKLLSESIIQTHSDKSNT